RVNRQVYEEFTQVYVPPSQKRNVSMDVNSYFKGRLDTHPTIKSCLQNKEKVLDVDMNIA
ncbi:unnamed protein product, partial [Brassica oleracea var. botrytis]